MNQDIKSAPAGSEKDVPNMDAATQMQESPAAVQVGQVPQPDLTPQPETKKKRGNRIVEEIDKEAQVYAEAEKKEEAQNSRDPVSVWGWLGLAFLMMIPIVNVIVVFKWAFSKKANINKKNYAIATLIVWGILLVIGIVLGIMFPHFYEPLINALAVLFVVG